MIYLYNIIRVSIKVLNFHYYNSYIYFINIASLKKSLYSDYNFTICYIIKLKTFYNFYLVYNSYLKEYYKKFL